MNYKLDYSKYAPQLASGDAKNFLMAASSPLERARRSLARNSAAPPTDKPQTAPAPVPPPRKDKPQPRLPQEQRRPAPPPKRRRKRPPVILAAITGLLLSAIVLLAATGLYGAYCYSQNLPGDTNARASTAMYCLAVFVGCFWASAMVKRQSLKPILFIGGVYMLLSLAISWHMFTLADFKITMILLKILLTAAAAALGYLLSLIPYLINKALKHK